MMLVLSAFIFWTVQISFAQENITTEDQPAVNVGNKICPVSGGNIDSSAMGSVTLEYKGKIYNFCCAACLEEFKKDPDKYINKVEEELQGGPKEQKQEESTNQSDLPIQEHNETLGQ